MSILFVLEPSVTTIRVYAIKTELESVRFIPLTTHILINLPTLKHTIVLMNSTPWEEVYVK
jgi:hypothetical protein